MGLFVISFKPDVVVDQVQAQRAEMARRELLPGSEGPVLVIIPRDAALVEREALEWWGSKDAMKGVAARAVVVPSSIDVLRDRIRWALFRPSVNYRAFRNPQIAKGWVLNTWYEESVGEVIDAMDAHDVRPL